MYIKILQNFFDEYCGTNGFVPNCKEKECFWIKSGACACPQNPGNQ